MHGGQAQGGGLLGQARWDGTAMHRWACLQGMHAWPTGARRRLTRPCWLGWHGHAQVELPVGTHHARVRRVSFQQAAASAHQEQLVGLHQLPVGLLQLLVGRQTLMLRACLLCAPVDATAATAEPIACSSAATSLLAAEHSQRRVCSLLAHQLQPYTHRHMWRSLVC